MFRFVIFDFDMTLVDSSCAVADTMNLVAAREGLPSVTREQVLSVIGMPIRESWLRIWGRFEERWLADFRQEFLLREFQGIRLFPGTKYVLETLQSLEVGLGIASNRQNPRAPLEAMGLESYFTSVVGMGDVENAKPAPDMIYRGMADLGGEAGNTLVAGDTADDMTAARRAGVRAVGLTTGNFTPASLRDAGAWRVLDSLEEILPIFSGHGRRKDPLRG